MPIPLALALGGAAFAGAGLNALSQGATNRANIKFAREMYNRQYADNIAFWNMQNQYNSPQSQIERMRAAGLNPALMYGSGAGSAGNAQAIQTPDVQRVTQEAPRWGDALSAGGLTVMNSIYDLDIKKQQADNLKAQNTVLIQEALLKSAQIDNTRQGIARSKFDLDLDSELRQVSADYRKESLRQLRNNIDLSLREDARRAAANSTSIQEAIERMLSMRVQRDSERIRQTKDRAEISRIRADTARIRSSIQGLVESGKISELHRKLWEKGINPSDPTWMRLVATGLENLFEWRPAGRTESFGGWWSNILDSIF